VENGLQQSLGAALRRLLRPLVRMMLRNGVPAGVFVEHVKKVYVDVALSEFAMEGRKPSISRAAVITGLTRKAVSQLAELGDDEGYAQVERYNRAARVLTAWVREPRFHSPNGQPAILAAEHQSEPSFAELVRSHGADMPSRAVLDELLRVGAVVRTDDGRVRLLRRAYVPTTGAREKIEILGSDVSELVSTIDHNLTHPPEDAFYQRKVAYDNLPLEFLPKLRTKAAALSQELLETLDTQMSAQDRDTTPEAEGTGRARAVIGIYYHQTDTSEQGPEED
jgi:hypothetical protein